MKKVKLCLIRSLCMNYNSPHHKVCSVKIAGKIWELLREPLQLFSLLFQPSQMETAHNDGTLVQ